MSGKQRASRLFAAALRAGGIEFVTGFPGSPTTSLGLYLECHAEELGVEFRWAINENVALSQAFGAAMGGRGAAALMKHVGVNVAADALQAMGVVHGLAAPLLLIEGADARPGSSQSAQDNRALFGSSPQLVVLGPSTQQEIAELVVDACELSRAAGMLVVVRGDARTFQAPERLDAPAEVADARARPPVSSFRPWPARGHALATSARTYGHHLETRAEILRRLRPWLERQWRGFGLGGDLHLAVVVAAHLGHEVARVLRSRRIPGLRLLVEHPLPATALLELARRVEVLVVLEECTNTLERELRAMVQRAGHRARIVGRGELGDPRPIGRLGGEVLEALIAQIERSCPPGRRAKNTEETGPPRSGPAASLERAAAWIESRRAALDERSPASGFPTHDRRKLLFSHLRGLADEVFIATDPGVTGLLALAEQRCDVKMHMGGAVPIAAGWSRARPEGLAVAVVGDTNLPHSEWLGLLDAIAHGDDLLVVVADNGASEMTQDIVTPRLHPTAALASLRAAGLSCHEAELTHDLPDRAGPWRATLDAAARQEGPRLVWVSI